MSVSRAAVVNHLVMTQRLLFADSEQVEAALVKLRTSGEVTPEMFEVLLSAQRTALRGPAQALFMVAEFLEPEQPKTIWQRIKAWIVLRLS